MKRLLTILILIFALQTPSQADDIRDFQIEGMSIGDSLLDFVTKKEIKKNRFIIFKNNKYKHTRLIKAFENYDTVEATYKKDDKDYKIVSLGGGIFMDNMNDCRKKQKEILRDIKPLFKSSLIFPTKGAHPVDKTGKSRYNTYEIAIDKQGGVQITCLDWSKKREKKRFRDNLNVTIQTWEYSKFLIDEVYKK